jgi:hypothetical protein
VEKFAEDREWEAEVRQLSNKGAVVMVDGVEGFLPRGRMGRQANKLTELKPGDKLTVRVVEVDPKRPSVIFGLPLEGGGAGGGGGGRSRSGSGGGGGGGRRRDGRKKSGPPAERAKPRNEMKSPTTQSSFSLGDMVSDELRQKFGIEEEPPAQEAAKPTPALKEEKSGSSDRPAESTSGEETATENGNQEQSAESEGAADVAEQKPEKVADDGARPSEPIAESGATDDQSSDDSASAEDKAEDQGTGATEESDANAPSEDDTDTKAE